MNGEDRSTLPFYAGWVVATGALGLVGAFLIPKEATDKLGALIGVAGSLFGGVVALALKKRALEKSVRAALAMMGAAFGMRLVLVMAGLALVVHKRWGTVAFVAGFFGVYFVLQWVEISYVLAEGKRRGPGGL